MPIKLQSTVGGFEPGFLRRLPALERAMIAQGLEPSSFVISKDRATPPTMPLIGPFFYEYTVFVDDDHFTVTEPNDMRFLNYLVGRIAAADDDDAAALAAKQPNIMTRLMRWMTQPV
jgi:hypothetical protein